MSTDLLVSLQLLLSLVKIALNPIELTKDLKAMVFLLTIILGIALSVSTVASRNICSGMKNGDQLPNIRDCSSYFVCSYGQPTLFQCKDTLLYDYHLGVCNWPENVTCAATIIGLPPITPPSGVPEITLPAFTHPPIFQTRPPVTHAPITHPSTAPPTTTVPTTTTTATRPQTTHPSHIIDPTYPIYPGYPGGVEGIPESENNHQTVPPYYQGIEGKPEFVNHPEIVPEPTPARSTPIPVTEVQTTTPFIQTTTPVIQTTTPFIQTTTPSVIEVTKPQFDDYYPGISIAPNNPEGFACTKDGLYFTPHMNNCQEYFICENHKLHRHRCGPGVHWDYIFSQCMQADNAYCFGAPQTTLGITGPIAIGTLSPPTQPPIVPEIVAEPVVDCPGNQAFFAHKTDCRKYYICIGGIPIATSCPEKMAWDNDNLQCSEDAEAQCLVQMMA